MELAVVDISIVTIIVISGIISMVRGFVKEAMSLVISVSYTHLTLPTT